ncbi:DUF3106 domain-containing protein [Pseudomonas sp.]|uniref:DUF3106 domain-containing protein n=1 Tax=Pseudomonas sp. TaxID=306 RepID=UPI0025E6BBA9|nr:DUF3106 domain-containing protein [Pseudomonas sp.]
MSSPSFSLRCGLGVALLGGATFLAIHGSVRGQSMPTVRSDVVVPQTKSAVRPLPSRPAWRELTAEQQQALYPLLQVWDELSEPHKRKWLALSRNHAKLSPAEQAVQHSRMTEWAMISQRERAQARFNFAAVKQLPADERKAKWEAYQALSPEEKRQLAERAPARPAGVAPTISPVPARKLAPVVAPTHRNGAPANAAMPMPSPQPTPPTQPYPIPAGDRPL